MANTPERWITENEADFSKSDSALIAMCQSQNLEERCCIGLTTPEFLNCQVTNQFLIWRPTLLPAGSSLSISSSRLNQKLELHSDWFSALRTLAVQISKEKQFLVTAPGTATHEFVRRIAELFQIPTVEFAPFPKNPTKPWFEQVASSSLELDANHEDRTIPSPVSSPSAPIKVFFKLRDDIQPAKNPPNINDLLIQSTLTSVLLSVRKGGNIERATEQRLNQVAKPATRLLINTQLTPKRVEAGLLELGATAWWVYDPTNRNQPASPKLPQPRERPILSLDEFDSENFLIHYTRRRVGPWPDQTRMEFLDDLIFHSSRRDHSNIASLCRILSSQRILASNDLSRDRRPVVCFSDIRINQILQQRIFRPHLGRWDFEPFGLALGRKWLDELGARPVVYGTESDWNDLAEDLRPYFQLEKSKSNKIDWRLEQEWRILGDLNLERIPSDQAVVFVETRSDAHRVAMLSRWPIVVLSSRGTGHG